MSITSRISKVFLAAVAALAVGSAMASSGTLNGAGGTAIYPVLSQWADAYQKNTGTESLTRDVRI